MGDKTNYAQSLTHMIKGNLGAGILAMPASFAHTGLVGAVLGLPVLCIISAYCVYVLVKSSQLIENKSKGMRVNYSNLAKSSFEYGPECMRRFGNTISWLVDGALLVTQIGVCCVYIVFVVDNVISILASYDIMIHKSVAFLAIFPVTLLLSFIRTLNRLAVASLLANLLQAVGLALIVEYLIRDLDKVNFGERDNFRPISEMALGFGSAMFAFEGISVVLPLYSRMKTPQRMLGACGVINVSFVCILVLYFIMGLLGFLKYGHNVKDSITLNLPAEPLYDAVRAMFTISILLSYPLQFYVPNEILWKWAKKNLFGPTQQELSVMRAIEVVIPPGSKITESIDGVKNYHIHTASPGAAATVASNSDLSSLGGALDDATINNDNHKSKVSSKITTMASPTHTTTCMPSTTTTTTTTMSKAATNAPQSSDNINKHQSTLSQDTNTHPMYEYLCRLLLVTLTFTLAFSVPKLNLLMDLIGSFSGAALCLTTPAAIHLAAYWNEKRGASKAFMVIFDSVIIMFSLAAGLGGSLSSLISIVKSLRE